MKLSVIYHSVSGNTAHMANVIAEGMRAVEGVEVGVFSIDNVDMDFVKESSCVVMGCPTYAASPSSDFYAWLGKNATKLSLCGKLGGAFATAQYTHGGGDLAIQNIQTHMLVFSMLVYSSGMFLGKPTIHNGPVAIAAAGDTEALKPFEDTFRIYGKRMAEKAVELFG